MRFLALGDSYTIGESVAPEERWPVQFEHPDDAPFSFFVPIPANDAWIAALALQHRMPVLSRDEHFDAVPGLYRESW